MSEPSPLPEDLAKLELLTAQIARLEPAHTRATEKLTRARAESSQLERELLRRQPPAPLSHRGAREAALLGFPVGLAVMTWWFHHPWNPALGVAISFTVSTTWLLRGAWRAGRAAGARGAG